MTSGGINLSENAASRRAETAVARHESELSVTIIGAASGKVPAPEWELILSAV